MLKAKVFHGENPDELQEHINYWASRVDTARVYIISMTQSESSSSVSGGARSFTVTILYKVD